MERSCLPSKFFFVHSQMMPEGPKMLEVKQNVGFTNKYPLSYFQCLLHSLLFAKNTPNLYSNLKSLIFDNISKWSQVLLKHVEVRCCKWMNDRFASHLHRAHYVYIIWFDRSIHFIFFLAETATWFNKLNWGQTGHILA